MLRADFRIFHDLAVLTSAVQAQHDRLSFAAQRRGEPESERDASSHCAKRYQCASANELIEPTDLRRGSTMPSRRLRVRVWQRKPH